MPEFERFERGSNNGNATHSSKPTGKNVKKRRKKQNVFISIISGLLPWKGDTKANVIRKLVFLASLVLIIYAVYSLIYFYFVRDILTQNELDRWASIKSSYSGEERIILNMPNDNNPGTDKAEDNPVEILGEYLEFHEENNDFVGYVEIFPQIQYPVVQGEDNEYYLHHNFEKIPTENGTVFADYEGKFTANSRPHNIILYGHNLRTKSLFQPLVFYRDRMDYLIEHHTINFDTLYERGKYKVFAIFQSNTKETHGEIFEYWNNIYFKNKEHFDNFVAECLDRSLYYTGVDLQYGDELLMLSTCDFSMFTAGADSAVRLVVAARRIREDENPLVDTGLFINNTGMDENGMLKRRMFEAYYDIFVPNGWGGRNWDLSYIKDFKG